MDKTVLIDLNICQRRSAGNMQVISFKDKITNEMFFVDFYANDEFTRRCMSITRDVKPPKIELFEVFYENEVHDSLSGRTFTVYRGIRPIIGYDGYAEEKFPECFV